MGKARQPDQCETTWNSGRWPYTTRCALTNGHSEPHQDRNGNSIPQDSPMGRRIDLCGYDLTKYTDGSYTAQLLVYIPPGKLDEWLVRMAAIQGTIGKATAMREL